MRQRLASRPRTKSLLVFMASPSHSMEGVHEEIRLLRALLPRAEVLAFQTDTAIAKGELSASKTALSFLFFDELEVHIHVIAQGEDGTPTPEAMASRVLATIGNHESPRLLGLFTALAPQELVTFLAAVSKAPAELPVFGGVLRDSTSDNCLMQKDGTPVKRGVAYFVLSGGPLCVTQEVDLGWQPLGRDFTVTSLDGPMTVLTLDQKPAISVYERYFGIAADEYFLVNARTFPFYLKRHGRELLRYPRNFRENGALVFGAPLHLGEKLRFAYGEPGQIIGGANRTRACIAAAQPESVFLTNCRTRLELLRDDIETEIAACSEVAPTTGFFSYGEFERAEGEILITNMTMIVTMLREGAPPENKKIEEPAPTTLLSYRSAILRQMAHYVDATTRELVALNARLNRQSITDELTGLVNRRELDRMFPELLEEAQTEKQPLSVLMVDIDNFKSINDQHGHSIGDAAIVCVANILTKATRRGDIVCRWGGDEFFLALPGATQKDAWAVGQRIETQAKAVREVGDTPLRLTLSIGVTTAVPKDDPQSLFHRADTALYRAKGIAGKGQVVIEI